MNIVFSVCCQVKLSVFIMVKVKKVFSFMFGVMLMGQFVYSVMISDFSVVVRQVVIKIVL